MTCVKLAASCGHSGAFCPAPQTCPACMTCWPPTNTSANRAAGLENTRASRSCAAGTPSKAADCASSTQQSARLPMAMPPSGLPLFGSTLCISLYISFRVTLRVTPGLTFYIGPPCPPSHAPRRHRPCQLKDWPQNNNSIRQVDPHPTAQNRPACQPPKHPYHSAPKPARRVA